MLYNGGFCGQPDFDTSVFNEVFDLKPTSGREAATKRSADFSPLQVSKVFGLGTDPSARTWNVEAE